MGRTKKQKKNTKKKLKKQSTEETNKINTVKLICSGHLGHQRNCPLLGSGCPFTEG